MAAKKTTTPAPPPEAPTPPAPPAEAISYIDVRDVLTTKTPVTRLDVEVNEQVRAILAAQCTAISAFVKAQMAKGFSEEEVMSFSSIELPLRMTVRERNGRTVVEYPFRINDGEEA